MAGSSGGSHGVQRPHGASHRDDSVLGLRRLVGALVHPEGSQSRVSDLGGTAVRTGQPRGGGGDLCGAETARLAPSSRVGLRPDGALDVLIAAVSLFPSLVVTSSGPALGKEFQGFVSSPPPIMVLWGEYSR